MRVRGSAMTENIFDKFRRGRDAAILSHLLHGSAAPVEDGNNGTPLTPGLSDGMVRLISQDECERL